MSAFLDRVTQTLRLFLDEVVAGVSSSASTSVGVRQLHPVSTPQRPRLPAPTTFASLASSSGQAPRPAHQASQAPSIILDLTRLQREVAELKLERSLLLQEESDISKSILRKGGVSSFRFVSFFSYGFLFMLQKFGFLLFGLLSPIGLALKRRQLNWRLKLGPRKERLETFENN